MDLRRITLPKYLPVGSVEARRRLHALIQRWELARVRNKYTFDQRTFSVAAVNNLPIYVRASTYVTAFTKALKTHILTKSYYYIAALLVIVLFVY